MPNLSRRKTLALLGGGAIVAAGAASAGFFATRTPNAALAPWDMAGEYADPRMRALSFGILAPNPHNRQPWIADLGTPGQVTLFVDTDRLLPHTDPFNRQITIGLGCFLELTALAAAEDGFAVEVDLFPQGSDPAALDSRPVALMRFVEGAGTPDPLFPHYANRRTEKEPYDLARPVPVAALSDIANAARHGALTEFTNDPNRVQALRDLSERALIVEIETPRAYKESVDLFRIGKAEVNANPDGIDFSGPMFETMGALGLFSRESALDTASMGYQQGRAAVLENTRTAMAHIWLVTPGNSRAEQIAAGRDWLRVHLAATAAGVAMQPLSQALQEYPEMTALYDKVHADLAPQGGTVQMFARLGYCAPVPPSPRWPLDAKVLNA